MDYALNYLKRIFPKEIVADLLMYEWDTKKHHLSLKLDSYVIYQKSTVCRQIKKPSLIEKEDNGNVYLDYAYKWNIIINANKKSLDYELKNYYQLL